MLPTPTLGDTSSTMFACLLFGFFIFFSSIRHCETNTYASLLQSQNKIFIKKLALSLFPRHNDVTPITGIEPATLRLLARALESTELPPNK